MAKTQQAKRALPYLRGLADDEYVHHQIRSALDGLASASRRIARKRGKAAEDKKLYDNLRQVATSVRNAAHALRRRQPEPKRRGRTVIAVAALAGGIALVITQRDRLKSMLGDNDGNDAGPETDAHRHTDSSQERVPERPTPTEPST
jgi:preprotein translocase subunit SecD